MTFHCCGKLSLDNLSEIIGGFKGATPEIANRVASDFLKHKDSIKTILSFSGRKLGGSELAYEYALWCYLQVRMLADEIKK